MEHPPSLIPANEQVTLFALTPMHTAGYAPLVMHTVLSFALGSLDDGRCMTDLDMAMGLSIDVDHGRTTLRSLLSYQHLDSLICFGKTYRSLGYDNMPMFEMLNVRFREQVKPIRTIALPAVLSSAWDDEVTVRSAAQAVKPLLVEDCIVSRPGGPAVFNTFDQMDMN